jgi:hypothetical protein
MAPWAEFGLREARHHFGWPPEALADGNAEPTSPACCMSPRSFRREVLRGLAWSMPLLGVLIRLRTNEYLKSHERAVI